MFDAYTLIFSNGSLIFSLSLTLSVNTPLEHVCLSERTNAGSHGLMLNGHDDNGSIGSAHLPENCHFHHDRSITDTKGKKISAKTMFKNFVQIIANGTQ